MQITSRPIKHYRLKLTGVALHALLLTLFTIALQYISFIRADELAFFKIFSVIKDTLSPGAPKPLAGRILFLDVSKDLQLTNDETIDGYDGADSLPGARVVLTDRRKLAKFFRIINQHPHGYQFIVCDVNFDLKSPDDTVLKNAIVKTDRLIVAANLQDGQIIKPVFNVPYGIVTYQAEDGSFTKMPIFYSDSVRSLPVILTERTSTKRYVSVHGINFENGYPAFNTIIPTPFYRTTDLISQTATHGANLFYLGEIINNKDVYDKYLKDKLIVIGNFSNDQHKTFLSNIPGSLILVNTYLSLKEGSLRIPWTWLFLLFTLYLVISYFIFLKPETKLENIHDKIKVKVLSGLIKTYITYIGILLIADLISYFFFGIFISLFYIASYLTLLELTLEKWKNYQNSTSFKAFLKEELL